jgi:aspartate aminotransferase
MTRSPLSQKALLIEESKTLALSARAKRMKSEGIDVVSLTAGEPDFPTPEAIKNAAIEAIHANFTKYTANAGIPELLKAIATKLKRENNLSFEPSQILVSNGAKHSVYNALQALCNRGNEVLIPAPFWVSYPEIAKLVDAKPVIIKTKEENHFKMTVPQLKRVITKKSKVLILNSPCNPTGAVYSRNELEELAAVVADSKMIVVSDEIYEKVLYDGNSHFSIGSVDAIRDRVITVNGVSKAFSMTGWRIGYAAGPKDVIAAMDKIQGQVTSNASSISQKAALAALTTDLATELREMLREFDRRRQFLLKAFNEMGVRYIHPAGAFYLFFNAKPFLNKRIGNTNIRNADDLCEHILVRHNVAMIPGTSFGAKEWVRISYACSMEELEKGAERLKKAFRELR